MFQEEGQAQHNKGIFPLTRLAVLYPIHWRSKLTGTGRCNLRPFLNNRSLLKCVGSNHAARHLAGNGDEWDTVEERVGEAADEIGGPGAGGGDADARLAGGTSVAFGGENSALLVAGKDVSDGSGASESLVDLHGSTARVGEHIGDSLALESFHEDVGTLPGLVGGKSRDRKRRIYGGDGGRSRSGGFRVGGAGDLE
ncbi:unnamed protein product [Linum tenue]|uniref:Uncharacterized protein n=1 Tax=Linum tenue TaxID=586396 RepID=A0AAV0MID6_9ROSI|nr:unnamed protein product [Linum tenue]CAI0446532.1 unnamed protein product [Linum tenue]